VINVVAAYFILGERITRREALGSLVLTAGAILAVFSGSREEPEEDVEGIKRLFRRAPFIIFTLCKVLIILVSGYIVFLSTHARRIKKQNEAYLDEMRSWGGNKKPKDPMDQPSLLAVAAIPLPVGPPDLMPHPPHAHTAATSVAAESTSIGTLPTASTGVVATRPPLPPTSIEMTARITSPQPLPAAGSAIFATIKNNSNDASASSLLVPSTSSGTATDTTTSSVSSSSSHSTGTASTPTEEPEIVAPLWSPRGKKPPAPFAAPPSPPHAPAPPVFHMSTGEGDDDEGIQLVGGANGDDGGWTITVDSDPSESKEMIAIHLDTLPSDAPAPALSSSEPPSPADRLTVRGTALLPMIPPSPLLASMAAAMEPPLPSTSATPIEPLRTNSEIDWVESMPSVHLHVVTGNEPARRPKPYVSGATIPPPSPLLYPVNSHLNQIQRAHVVRFHCETLRKIFPFVRSYHIIFIHPSCTL
jgi:hypothetical protein